MKGIFITFEGIEGSGKSTQAQLVRELLVGMGLDVVLTREPGGSAIGEKIREILLDSSNRGMEAMTELLLYEASRYQHVAEVIIPALDAGKVVVCDRFFDASTAYQGFGRGIKIETVIELNLIATSGLKADLTIVLDLPVEEGLRRLGRSPDRIEGEKVEFHEKVRKGYLKIAQSEPERVRVINAQGTIDETFEQVRSVIEEFLKLRKVRS